MARRQYVYSLQRRGKTTYNRLMKTHSDTNLSTSAARTEARGRHDRAAYPVDPGPAGIPIPTAALFPVSTARPTATTLDGKGVKGELR